VKAHGILALVGALTIVGNARAQVRPDFSGHWKLDQQASNVSGGGRGDPNGQATGGGGGAGGGIGLGPAALELIIQQSDTALVVQEILASGDTAPIQYRLKGGRVRNMITVGRGRISEAQYSSRWDKSRISTSIDRNMTSARGNTRLQYRELRYLADDGAMIVDITMQGRPGGRKSIYRKTS